VADKVSEHLDRLSLGAPLLRGLTVKATADSITKCEGFLVKGECAAAFAEGAANVKELVDDDEKSKREERLES
jgi:hypothetical protein